MGLPSVVDNGCRGGVAVVRLLNIVLIVVVRRFCNDTDDRCDGFCPLLFDKYEKSLIRAIIAIISTASTFSTIIVIPAVSAGGFTTTCVAAA